MLLHFAICDDDAAQIEYLSREVSAWAEVSGHNARTHSFSSAEAFLFEYSENENFDILLLDIEMPGMNGMELAKKIRQNRSTVQIVFITGYSDYISEGYDVSALHYLMKPVSREKLFSVLDRAAELLVKNSKIILLETSSGTFRVPISEIRYIEVIGNYVTVHAIEEYKIKNTLAAVERQLCESFFRTGRSYLVNLDRIRKATKKEVFLTTGESVPLSRGVYERLMNEIINRK